jgi:hypothetical protein
LSRAEADAVREFIAQGGVVIADGEPGTFNEHSRRLSMSSLADLFRAPRGNEPVSVQAYGRGKAIFLKTNTTDYLQNRLVNKEASVHRLVGDLLHSNGIRPEFAVTNASGGAVVGVETHVFRNGGVSLITLLSNPLLRVDELGPPDFRSNQRFEKAVALNLRLPQAMYLYDTRQQKSLGRMEKISLTLSPYEPIILAASPIALPQLQINAPTRTTRGASVRLGVSCDSSPAAAHIFHLEVRDPTGKLIRHYSENVIGDDRSAMKLLPFAYNDLPGTWTLHVRDMISGQTVDHEIAVD